MAEKSIFIVLPPGVFPGQEFHVPVPGGPPVSFCAPACAVAGMRVQVLVGARQQPLGLNGAAAGSTRAAPKPLPEGWQRSRYQSSGGRTQYKYSNPAFSRTANSVADAWRIQMGDCPAAGGHRRTAKEASAGAGGWLLVMSRSSVCRCRRAERLEHKPLRDTLDVPCTIVAAPSHAAVLTEQCVALRERVLIHVPRGCRKLGRECGHEGTRVSQRGRTYCPTPAPKSLRLRRVAAPSGVRAPVVMTSSMCTRCGSAGTCCRGSQYEWLPGRDNVRPV